MTYVRDRLLSESLLQAELRYRDSHALHKGWRFSSYRSEGGAEVDVIIEDGRNLIAIEVKAGRTVSKADTRGLASLAALVGRGHRLTRWIVYRGDRQQRFEDGVEVWPVLDAIQALRDR
jgi:predicted AAA+ superfamily ATPase